MPVKYDQLNLFRGFTLDAKNKSFPLFSQYNKFESLSNWFAKKLSLKGGKHDLKHHSFLYKNFIPTE